MAHRVAHGPGTRFCLHPWALVSVIHPVASSPIFSWADCDNSLGNKEWELLLCYKAARHLRIEENCLNVLQTHNCKITEITKTKNSWMMLFPDKIYPALSFKCMFSSPAMNANKLPYIDDKAFIKKLFWP